MAELDRTSFVNNLQNETEQSTYQIYTKKSIGYADGYSRYEKKSGARTKEGNRIVEVITKPNPVENVKSLSPELLLDKQSNLFRRINGYGKTRTSNSDSYEDPTFLIFDVNLMKFESPLFRSDIINNFINDYSSLVPEISERIGYWEEFTNILFKIFPSDVSDEGDGIKRHYIESISGLDVLLKPIINYPEDKIVITISEDIAMTLQYLSELYNNLVYSYSTHRYLIPENLLRFDMRITIRDVRNMRKPIYNNEGLVDIGVSEDVSKFIYILHDCQFNFMNTKNFGGEIKRGGFGASSAQMSNGGNIDINFKSYSKITAPLLIDNSKIIDFRERESNGDKNLYRVLFNDVKSEFEIMEFEKRTQLDRDVLYKSNVVPDINGPSIPSWLGVDMLQLPEINTDIRGWTENIKNEIFEVRDVIIRKIYEEANLVIRQGQRYLGETVGFTLGKVNVYYDNLDEKITRFAWMFETFLDETVDELLGRNNNEPRPRWKNIYNDGGQYNEKYPEGDIHPDGTYNEKYPEGDIHPDGQYNEKYPEGDIHPNGQYNEKYPEGDVHPDGTYNEKYPEGDVHPDGTYNEKYPEGDIHPDGQYNEKYPDGDVHLDGTYNEKYPDGDIQEDGKYNEKYPEGDIQENGKYNEKYPEGDVHPDGTYNEKYPDGDLYGEGKYNEKYPEGDLYGEGKYNEKYPNDKKIQNSGTYNEKYPEGDLYGEGKYNEKYPEGDLYGEGKYNEKYPEGDVHPDGTYNEKYPEGDLYDEGKYNENYPDGNIYKKSTPKSVDGKLKNVYKNKNK